MSDILLIPFLGIIQGLTEFLPVSSSGHLTIFSSFFGLELDAQNLKALFAFLHLGTFFAVLFFTYKDLLKIFKGFFIEKERKNSLKLFWLLFLATVPAVVVALLFENQIDSAFSSYLFPSLMLFITAFILFASDKLKGNQLMTNMAFKGAIIIGFFQAFSILPGISRSGATLFAALLIGLNREDAIRFSFLLSLPITLGAGLTQLSRVTIDNVFLFYGFIASFLAGLLGLWLLKKLVIKGKLKLFGIYCIIFGVASIVYFGVV
ncbi:MAG: undecaprenyl-diphosphate phosphatase [Kosmotogaceae bacterium]